MLSYEEFKVKLLCTFMSYMGPGYKDYELKTMVVNKVNVVLDGFSVVKKGKETQMAPTLYINDVYSNYVKSMDFDYEINKCASVMKRGIKYGKNFIPDLDYKNVSRKIIFQLINPDTNAELLKDVPSRDFLDMKLIYRWIISIDSNGLSSVVIHNELAESLKLSERDLYDLAYENTRYILPPEIRRLRDIFTEMLVRDGISEDEALHAGSSIDKLCEFSIIGNTYGFLGAASIVYLDVLERYSQNVGTDLYILPSSINETIVIPCSDNITPDKLQEMVINVNSHDVCKSDKLSDSVYMYISESSELMKVR